MIDAFNTALDGRYGDTETALLLRGIYNQLESLNLETSIKDAVEGLEFKADNREIARVVRKYA